jgi:hypothetical protein
VSPEKGYLVTNWSSRLLRPLSVASRRDREKGNPTRSGRALRQENLAAFFTRKRKSRVTLTG